jgi:hypothetical protein
MTEYILLFFICVLVLAICGAAFIKDKNNWRDK